MAGWAGRTAVEIAAAVSTGDARARDVVAEHLDRIGRLNAELGAFVRVRPAAALREAGEVDQRPDRDRLPLAGVPVAIRTTCPSRGSRCALAAWRPWMLRRRTITRSWRGCVPPARSSWA